MAQAWRNMRFPDRQHHRSPQRRWSPELRELADYCPTLSADLISVRDAKVHKHTRKLTKKDIENTQKLLQLQADNFVRSLEIQSLQNSVNRLLEVRGRAEEGFRQFQSELKALEREVVAKGTQAVLDYSLSEQDWLDIIER